MNEWMNEWPFIPIHTDMYEHKRKEVRWNVKTYSGNTLECIHMLNDSLDNWLISLMKVVTTDIWLFKGNLNI